MLVGISIQIIQDVYFFFNFCDAIFIQCIYKFVDFLFTLAPE